MPALTGTITALAVRLVLTIVFTLAHELKGPPDASAAPLSEEKLRDLARLEAIDAKMAWGLLALLLASLWLFAALDAPRWVGIGWLVVLAAFWVRWSVVVLRYERSILAKRSS